MLTYSYNKRKYLTGYKSVIGSVRVFQIFNRTDLNRNIQDAEKFSS
jgi:hypothetical protein